MGKPVAAALANPEGPSCPRALAYLWADFLRVSQGIAATGVAPAVITWDTLAAWCALTHVVLEPWEAETIVMLGHLRAAITAEQMAQEKPK